MEGNRALAWWRRVHDHTMSRQNATGRQQFPSPMPVISAGPSRTDSVVNNVDRTPHVMTRECEPISPAKEGMAGQPPAMSCCTLVANACLFPMQLRLPVCPLKPQFCDVAQLQLQYLEQLNSI